MTTEEIKTNIKRSYGEIAQSQTGCCGTAACCTDSGSMAEGYEHIEGYVKEADLSLGCGIPTEIADIREGNTVVDLGSGAGNDAFIARRIVGETGRVIGVDTTPEMVIRALQNNQKLGFRNVEFVHGDIEDMRGIPDQTADVVISNCVMNLVPDKAKAFKEIFRILKTGGHFSISDIVYSGTLPDAILEAAEMFAGCVSGAAEKGSYLGIVKAAGFKNIQIKKERRIELPDELLAQYLSADAVKEFKNSGAGIYSITLYADKLDQGSCCESGESGCCGSEVPKSTQTVSCCGSTAGQKSSCCG